MAVTKKSLKPSGKAAKTPGKAARKPTDRSTDKTLVAAPPKLKPATKAAVKKPLPSVAPAGAPVPGTNIPKQILNFLEKFDSLKPGKLWAEKAAALVEKLPAGLFADFQDALDLDSPLSSRKIPLHLIDPKSAKGAGTKTLKGGVTAQIALKTFTGAILKNKIGRDELEELIERLRQCLCCCQCWPCRPWPFCRICRWRLVKVTSTADAGWVYHLNFLNASAAIANREAQITCPTGGSAGGPWAPQVWNASTPATEAPVGYSPAGHNHDADYSADDHNHDALYAPKKKGGTDLKYVELRSVDAAAKTATLRDVVTAPTPTDVVVSQSGHNHDGAYSLSGHDHDTAYAAKTHDHNTAYAPISGSVNYAAATHVHKKTQAGRLETPASSGGTVTVNLVNMVGAAPANIKVHATAFGKKTGAHFPMYVTDCAVTGDTTLAKATFTIQHADGTVYNSGDTMTWGIYAKMILSFVATENQ